MRITIIGKGNMGTALAKRLSPHHEVSSYGRDPNKPELSRAEIVILAVKPQSLNDVNLTLQPDQILVSLLAGTPLDRLKKQFSCHLVRMMPNLAIGSGAGLIGLATDDPAVDKEMLTTLCAPLGKVHWLQESKFDAFTALAASGPAFFFAMLEAMVEAGIVMGFPAKESQAIVHQMVRGGLVLLEESGRHPADLKWQIASPGGTTIAGLKVLEESALRAGILNTFLAAYERAKQLH